MTASASLISGGERGRAEVELHYLLDQSVHALRRAAGALDLEQLHAVLLWSPTAGLSMFGGAV